MYQDQIAATANFVTASSKLFVAWQKTTTQFLTKLHDESDAPLLKLLARIDAFVARAERIDAPAPAWRTQRAMLSLYTVGFAYFEALYSATEDDIIHQAAADYLEELTMFEWEMDRLMLKVQRATAIAQHGLVHHRHKRQPEFPSRPPK